MLNPLLVTCDFSTKLIAAIKEVYGPDVLQIDGFHVMQLLNNGIRRDLLDFRDAAFQAEIRELFTLRRWISQVQTEVKECGRPSSEALASPPPLDPSHSLSTFCLQVVRQAFTLFEAGAPSEYFARLQAISSNLAGEPGEAIQEFCASLQRATPKRRPTAKGQVRAQAEVLKKLKALILGYRATLAEESRAFYKDHWFLFFQPERLNEKRSQRLAAFLAKYPALQEYRDLTLLMGELYRRDPADIDGHQIDDLAPLPHYSKKLQAAICTITEHRDDILRFVEVYKAHPDLPKACRANMEPFNYRIKAPFKRGKNCTKRDHLQGKLQLQLGCEVRFFMEEEGEVAP